MTQTIDYDFDTLITRRGTGSSKWGMYPDDVLPMWVADMDFQSPPAVLEALQQKVDHGVFGYSFPPPTLTEAIVERMARLYDWEISPEAVLYTPGVMVGVNLTARAIAGDGGGVLIQPPVYFPFHRTPEVSGGFKQEAVLSYVPTDDGFTYEIDFDAFEAAITPETRLFLLCSPHNPVGRVWTRDELAQMVEICARHDVVICSDEIHSDLLLGGTQHTPTALIDPDMRAKTVTLIAPSKTYNQPGLGLAVAIIEDKDLRNRFVDAGLGLVHHRHGDHVFAHINMMGYAAADAAYRHSDDWLRAVLSYIEANRDFVHEYVAEHMPEIKLARLEGTYLQWMDCRALDLPDVPGDWFRDNAKVAFNNGEMFGAGGEGFVRMNLGTPRARVQQALEQMRAALEGR